MPYLQPIYDWYGRFERPVSSLSLLGGFVFDALTLRRLDTLWENFWILGHLLIIAVFIVLIHVKENKDKDEQNPSKAHFWFVNILQFFFGGTLSVYLVFYFRSADIFVTWPFIAILAVAFMANESMKRHYVRFSFQIGLFFLSLYSFFFFLLPVLIHRLGTDVFLMSGLLSLIVIMVFISVIFYFAREKFVKDKMMVITVVLIIFGAVNLLYFTRLIPPIPLSLKDAGVYHSIEKNSDGNYEVQYEDYGLKGYFTLYPDFHETDSSPVYAYSAIFSPSDLNLSILHEWQHYDEDLKSWVTESTVRLPVVGGREDGFRTYSFGNNLLPGKWRINIETEQGHVIGRVRFQIVKADKEPLLSIEVKK